MKHLSKTDESRDVVTFNLIGAGINLLVTKDAKKHHFIYETSIYPDSNFNQGFNTETSLHLIPIVKNANYVFSKISTEGDNYWRIMWLDSDLNSIYRSIIQLNEQVLTPPTNASYMWVSYPINCKPKIEIGNVATAYSKNFADV